MTETFKIKTFYGLFIILISFMILFGMYVKFPYVFIMMIFPIPFTLIIMRLSRIKK